MAERQFALAARLHRPDGDHDVARILKPPHQQEWTWSVFAVAPARAGVTNGHELDPKEARRKVQEAWNYAKAHKIPIRTAVTTHWSGNDWSSRDSGPQQGRAPD